jgi:WS/DGAT/MGAT family acyltransferase
MSNVDVAWLRMDDPTNLMVINGVLVFEGRMEVERLRAVVERRLVPIPRFRQRVVTGPGRPRWEPDPEFDVHRHLVETELPGAGGDDALGAEISRLMSDPLDYARPLWSFHLLHNYQGGHSVLFARVHHCIGDGIALMLVLLSLTDLPGQGEGLAGNPLSDLFLPGDTDLEAVREHTHRVLPDAMRLLLHPVEALRSSRRWLVRTAATGCFGRLALRPNDPKTVFKGPLGVAKRVAWSDPVPLTEIKALQDSLGGTINDLLLTAMTGALRRYLERRGGLPAGRLDFRAAVPVNLRPLENMVNLGNEFGLVFLPLPVGIAEPERRLAELRRRMARLKRSAESVMVLGALRFLGMGPAAIQRLVVRILGGKATAVMTNVPGPREQLWFGGRPIRDIFFWVPQSGRLGIGISICTYAGAARLGVVTDQGLVPDPEAIVAAFHQELDAMHRLAGRRAAPAP